MAFSYDKSVWLDPSPAIYAMNLVRLIVENPKVFDEVGAENGISLLPLTVSEVFEGKENSKLETDAVFIEAVSADVDDANKSDQKVELIIVVRIGENGTLQEQYRRAQGYLQAIQRLIKKLFTKNYSKELIASWPYNLTGKPEEISEQREEIHKQVGISLISIKRDANSQDQAIAGYKGKIIVDLSIQLGPNWSL